MMKQRVLWIDVAKGIGIICVVLGHMGIPGTLGRYLFSFHMPLFFFLSGFLFSSEDRKFSEHVFKRLYSILIPYFFFSVLTIIAWGFINNDVSAFKINIWDTILGYGYGPLWFLPCFFVTDILFFGIKKITTDKKSVLVCILLICSVIGYSLSLEGIKFAWKVDVLFTALVFYSVGYLVKTDMMNAFTKYINRLKIFVFFLSFIFSVIFCYINPPGQYGHVDMANNYLGNVLFFYISAFAGIIVVLFISRFIPPLKGLVFVGQNTLIILAIHFTIPKILIRISALILHKTFEEVGSNFIIKNGTRVLSLLLIVILIMFFNRFVPFIVGKRSSTRTKVNQCLEGDR